MKRSAGRENGATTVLVLLSKNPEPLLTDCRGHLPVGNGYEQIDAGCRRLKPHMLSRLRMKSSYKKKRFKEF